MVIPKKSSGVSITANYNKLNQIRKLSKTDPSRGLRPGLLRLRLGVFRVRLCFLVPPDNETQGHSSSNSVLHTHIGLYEWIVMPQGSSTSPGRLVKVIDEVIKNLNQVVAYVDDVIMFDSDTVVHVRTFHSLFKRFRNQNLKLSPSKALLGATDANVLGHLISPAGLRPNAEKVSALTNTSMPTDVTQVRALMGGVNYYRKICYTYKRGFVRSTHSFGKGLSLPSRLLWKSWCVKARPSSRPGRSSFTLIETPSTTAHARFTCITTHASTVQSRSRTRAGGRLHKTHRVHQPSYTRLGKALDSFHFGGWQHRLGSRTRR